ncbi:unnamed protein product [Staurois parvus]|uniref:Uncharacterized protein n=1 Tax=Staurois parvus TaxID=386267 RepID=A0ABN9DS43_9NEOB|nr:unnamed protein product [Staurois parvus]
MRMYRSHVPRSHVGAALIVPRRWSVSDKAHTVSGRSHCFLGSTQKPKNAGAEVWGLGARYKR